MPEFLEKKLKREYPHNSHAVYGTMNAIGAMHGNKETTKGRAMQEKHEAKVKEVAPKVANTLREMRIEVHRDKGGKITGHTVHHHHMPAKKQGTMATYESPESTAHPFGKDQGGEMLDHVAEHLGIDAE